MRREFYFFSRPLVVLREQIAKYKEVYVEAFRKVSV